MALVHVRLDRDVSNTEWFNLFPNLVVHHIVIASSDHIGILVDLSPIQVCHNHRKRKLF